MKKKKIYRVGTRGSKLALKQTQIVIEQLEKAHPECSFIVKKIKTTGDSIWDKSISEIGGKGLFVKEIEEALLNRDIEFAVHSVKDMPTEMNPSLCLGAVLKRENPCDALISPFYSCLDQLRADSTIGTSSLRRKSQLLSYKGGLKIVPIRGNVDTRIRKIEELGLDGIILAFAGIKRMGFEHLVREIISVDSLVPPSGQGAIGIEILNDDSFRSLLLPLNDNDSFKEIEIERTLQAILGGGCQVPLGINVSISGETVILRVALGKEDGSVLYREKKVTGTDDWESMVNEVAGEMRPIMKRI